jgi:hypothetical protein
MRSTILLVATTVALAGCSAMPFSGGDAEKPTATGTGAVPLAVTTAASADLYQIKDADRGMVRRVKVLLNGRTVDTLVMSKGREGSTTHCCTADGCQEIEPAKACTTFKMTCDQDGACVSASALTGSRL